MTRLSSAYLTCLRWVAHVLLDRYDYPVLGYEKDLTLMTFVYDTSPSATDQRGDKSMRLPDCHFDSGVQAEWMRLMRTMLRSFPHACGHRVGARLITTPRALDCSLDRRPGRACQTDKLRSQISPFGPFDVPIGSTSQPESHPHRTMATRIH